MVFMRRIVLEVRVAIWIYATRKSAERAGDCWLLFGFGLLGLGVLCVDVLVWTMALRAM